MNLHTAPGVGNAVGALFNARANKAPLLVTAGQQVRPHVTMQANLTNRDATRVPQPVREVELRAAAGAGRARRRSAGRSTRRRWRRAGRRSCRVPMDDWDAEADDGDGRSPTRSRGG